jgi:hypothetical protein
VPELKGTRDIMLSERAAALLLKAKESLRNTSLHVIEVVWERCVKMKVQKVCMLSL